MKKICFIPYKAHIFPLVKEVANFNSVHIIMSDRIGRDLGPSVQCQKSRFYMFGLGLLIKGLRKEILPPTYISGLYKYLRTINPEVVVFFDFYHWYSLQTLLFGRRNTITKVICFCETRNWPSRSIPRIFLRFCFEVSKLMRYPDCIITYTNQGKEFCESTFPASVVEVLPAPVDSKVFYPVDMRVRDKGPLKILMNARFVACKRHADLLEALKLVRAQ